MDKILAKAFIENINGKMVAIATDETVDRHGESLSIDAWDLKNFKKNPVLQWAHDYSSPPVGLAKNIKRDGERLVFEPVFHEYTQHAREVKKLYEEGIMTAFSVGFIPHYNGEGKEQSVKLELLEISAVPVPANPAAIIIEKSIKEITDEDKSKIKVWMEAEVKQENEPEIVEQKELVEKAGRVLSKKNRNAIEAAMVALQEVLDADSVNDGDKNIQPEVLKVQTEEDIITKNNNKGRDQGSDLTKEILVAMRDQIGYIARKVSKK